MAINAMTSFFVLEKIPLFFLPKNHFFSQINGTLRNRFEFRILKGFDFSAT